MIASRPNNPGEDVLTGGDVAPADGVGTPITKGARVILLVDTRDGVQPDANGVVDFVDDEGRVWWRDDADRRMHSTSARALRVVSFPAPLSQDARATALAAINRVLALPQGFK